MESKDLNNARVGGWEGLVDLVRFLFVTAVIVGAVAVIYVLQGRAK